MKNNPEEKVEEEGIIKAVQDLKKVLIIDIIKEPLERAKGFNTLFVNPRLEEHIKSKDGLHIIFFWLLVFAMPLLAVLLCITVLKAIWEIFITIFVGLTAFVRVIVVGIYWQILNILPEKNNKIN